MDGVADAVTKMLGDDAAHATEGNADGFFTRRNRRGFLALEHRNSTRRKTGAVLLRWPAHAGSGAISWLRYRLGRTNWLWRLGRHRRRHLRRGGLNVAAGDAPADAGAFDFGDVYVEISC